MISSSQDTAWITQMNETLLPLMLVFFSLILHRFHFNITAARKAEAAAKAAAQKEADGMYFIMISHDI